MSRAYPYPDLLGRAQRRVGIDDHCRHDNVSLEGNEDHHLIECNQCARWWRCYGQLAGVWADFIKYSRLDGSDPPTVTVVCSPKAWSTTDNDVEDVGFEYGGSRYAKSVLHGSSAQKVFVERLRCIGIL